MTDPVPVPDLLAAQFAGMRVVESVWLTQSGTPYEVRRTWRERLFTRPWRPLRATRTVVPQVPYEGAVQLNATTIAMHPAIVRKLKASLSK